MDDILIKHVIFPKVESHVRFRHPCASSVNRSDSSSRFIHSFVTSSLGLRVHYEELLARNPACLIGDLSDSTKGGIGFNKHTSICSLGSRVIFMHTNGLSWHYPV